MNYNNHEERRYVAAYNRRRNYLKDLIFRKMYFSSKFYKITTVARLGFAFVALLLFVMNDFTTTHEKMHHYSIEELSSVSKANYSSYSKKTAHFRYHVTTEKGNYQFMCEDNFITLPAIAEVHRDICYKPMFLQMKDIQMGTDFYTSKMVLIVVSAFSLFLFIGQKKMQLLLLKLNTQVLLFLQMYFFILYLFQIEIFHFIKLHIGLFMLAILLSLFTKIENKRLVWVSYIGEKFNARD